MTAPLNFARSSFDIPEPGSAGDCAVFYRVSTKRQKDLGGSLKMQAELTDRLALAYGLNIAYTLDDAGISGFKSQRDGYQTLKEIIPQKKIRAVVAYDPDRVARGDELPGEIMSLMLQHGVRFLTVENQPDPSDMGQIIYRLLSSLRAKAVRDQRKAVVNTMESRARDGKIGKGGIPPYGMRYKWGESFTKKPGAPLKIVPDPNTIDTLKEMFRWADEEGLADHAIARRLNEKPVDPPSKRSVSGVWSDRTVGRILRNPVYKGIYIHGKRKVQGEGDYRKIVDVKEPDAWIPVIGVATQVIATDVWDRVQKRDRTRHSYGDGQHSHRYALKSRAYCECGNTLQGKPTGPGGIYVRYKCSDQRHNGPRSTCKAPSWSGRQLEAAVWKVVVEALSDEAVVEKAVEELERLQAGTSIPKEIAKKQRELRAVQERIAVETREKNEMKPDSTARKLQMVSIAALTDQEEALTARIDWLTKQLEQSGLTEAKKRTIMEGCEIVKTTAAKATPEMQNEIYRALDLRVESEGEGWFAVTGNIAGCSRIRLRPRSSSDTVTNFLPFPHTRIFIQRKGA